MKSNYYVPFTLNNPLSGQEDENYLLLPANTPMYVIFEAYLKLENTKWWDLFDKVICLEHETSAETVARNIIQERNKDIEIVRIEYFDYYKCSENKEYEAKKQALCREGRELEMKEDEWERKKKLLDMEINGGEAKIIHKGTWTITWKVDIYFFSQRTTEKELIQKEHVVVAEPTDARTIVDAEIEKIINKKYRSPNLEVEQIYDIEFWEEKKTETLKSQKLKKMHPLAYRKLPDDITINQGNGQCVVDFMQFAHRDAKMKFKRSEFIEQMQKINPQCIEDGISTEDLEQWIVKNNKKYISIHAFNVLGEKFFTHVRIGDHTKLALVFMVQDNHIYPLVEEHIKNDAIKKGRIDWGHIRVLLPEIKPGDEQFVMIDKENINDEFIDIIKETQTAITQFSTSSEGVNLFVHPLNGKYWLAAPDEALKRKVLQKLMQKWKYNKFVFKNQSWAQIGMDLAQIVIGRIPKSYYNNDQLFVLNEHKRGPYMVKFVNPCEIPPEMQPKIISIDYNRAYTAICLQSRYKYYAFAIADFIKKFAPPPTPQELKPGEYSLKRDEYWGHMFIQRGFWSYCVVQEMLLDGTITFEDIDLQLVASIVLPANLFEGFARITEEMFPSKYGWDEDKKKFSDMGEYPKVSKNIINMYIGLLHKKAII
jgi:hypothetical protein